MHIIGKKQKDNKNKMVASGNDNKSSDSGNIIQSESDLMEYTLQDLIASNIIEIDFRSIRVDNKYYRSFIVVGYPRTVDNTWLSPLINFDAELAISMFYYPIDSDQILEKLKRKIAELEASLSNEYQSGKVMDPKNKVALEDAQRLLDDIASGKEKFFNSGMYIRLSAPSEEELESESKNLISTLAAIGLEVVPATLNQDLALHATLPQGQDPLYRVRNMDTSSIARTFPFVSSELTMDKGILYGINLHNNSLVIYDRFSAPNANEVVFATSGAGKSYYVKLQALRYLLTGAQIFIIDPENEYEKLADAVDGNYITFSQDSGAKINPFEFIRSPSAEDTNVLRDKILSLHTFFKILFGESISNKASAVLDKALILTYKEKGITSDKSTWKNDPPLLEDLYKILKGMVEPEAHDMASRLEKFIIGSASGVFNLPTNIDISNNFTVFSIRDLRDELRPMAMFIILDYIWTKVREERRRRLMIVDEAWTMMQYEDSAKFIFGIAKRARKYYLGLTTISQDVDEFLGSKYGKAVVTNASLKMLLKQNSAAIDLITHVFNLSSGERNFLLNARRGEGIFFADQNHVAIKVISNKAEHRLITSDPKELEKMKKASETSEVDIDEGSDLFNPEEA